jgi:hypothetical protein
LLVFAAVTRIDEAFVAAHIELMARQRGGDVEAYRDFQAHLSDYFNNMTDQEKSHWADQQVYRIRH